MKACRKNLWRVYGIFIVSVMIIGCTGTVQEIQAKTRTVVDLRGRQVEIPAEVQRVATFVGPSYDKTFMLGEAEKIVLLSFPQLPWAQKLNPKLAAIPTTPAYQDPNVEDILQANVDVVFYWHWPKPVEKMTDSGIPVVCALGSFTQPGSIEEFINSVKEEVRLYGEVLGKKAQQRAEEYCVYFDETVQRILSVTSAISDHEKSKVYYVRGPNVLTTHGKSSNTRWYVEMAGGKLVSKELEIDTFGEISLEQVLAWNPDIIMMGRLDSTDAIMHDPKWQTIAAVERKQVYVNPQGHFYWDYGSEGALFLLFLAKTFHPEKFADIDMVQELKAYYARFYHYDLTDQEAQQILNHLPPHE